MRLPLSIFEKELLTELNVAPAQLHPNNWAFVRAFTILCSQLGLSPTVEVFLYFFKAKQPSDRQLWASLNGATGRALLTLFQSSYKGFKGKFWKSKLTKEIQPFWLGFLYIGVPSQGFRVLNTWKICVHQIRKCANSCRA